MVAEAHEFTAAGVIVHNCVWALTELTDNFGASAWLNWARKKAAEAETPPPPGPEIEPEPEPAVVIPLDPMAARKAVRDAMWRAQRS